MLCHAVSCHVTSSSYFIHIILSSLSHLIFLDFIYLSSLIYYLFSVATMIPRVTTDTRRLLNIPDYANTKDLGYSISGSSMGDLRPGPHDDLRSGSPVPPPRNLRRGDALLPTLPESPYSGRRSSPNSSHYDLIRPRTPSPGRLSSRSVTWWCHDM